MLLIGFILTLGILIVAHEYGHYKVARLCGVKVQRFSVGFGRVIWRRQPTPGGTEFVISAIPFGGYVKWWDTRTDIVPPDQRAYAFDQQPLGRRAAIVAAGPVTNLLLAVLFFAAAHWVGVDEPRAVLATPPAKTLAAEAGLMAGDFVEATAAPGGEWHEVESLTDLVWQVTQAGLHAQDLQLQLGTPGGGRRRVVTLSLSSLAGQEFDEVAMRRVGIGAPYSEARIKGVNAGGAAEAAGLQAGDLVLSIDGRPVPDAQALFSSIRAHASSNLPAQQWVVERRGQRVTLEVAPRPVTENGETFGRIDAPIGGELQLVNVRLGPWDGAVRGVTRTWEMAGLNLTMIGRMLTGQASLRNLSGPITIGDYAGRAIKRGLSYYLAMLATVSVGLGVLNLLPLPILDGGHLMYYLFEGVTGRPVSDLWHMWLQRSGVLVLLLMMTIALSNDVARLLGL